MAETQRKKAKKRRGLTGVDLAVQDRKAAENWRNVMTPVLQSWMGDLGPFDRMTDTQKAKFSMWMTMLSAQRMKDIIDCQKILNPILAPRATGKEAAAGDLIERCKAFIKENRGTSTRQIASQTLIEAGVADDGNSRQV